jgi:ABC-2 type transport system permease protein
MSAVFDLASRMILITGTVVSYVYCAEALHGERRDRGILFWKTWPVGDTTAVAAKVIVAMAVVPAVTLALLFAAQAIARIIVMWNSLQLNAPMATPVAAALEVFAATLWIAPVYAWIMIVSATARRAVLLLAFLPLVLVSVLEPMIGGGTTIGHMLFFRGVGRHWPMPLSLTALSRGPMFNTPAPELLQRPSLWGGVVLAVLLLAVVVRQRSRMMPIS